MYNNIYEEPRHLNIKKVVIISIILIILLASIIFLIARKISTVEEENVEEPIANTTTVFNSNDNSISIELSSALNLKSYDSGLNYLMELRSENNLNIYIAKETMVQNHTLTDIIEVDKTTFLANFESYSNLSEIKELSVNDNLAYTYSFHYLDKNLNEAFYLQVIWLQVGDSLYIFDIDFPLNDLSFNTNIASSILSTFKINS